MAFFEIFKDVDIFDFKKSIKKFFVPKKTWSLVQGFLQVSLIVVKNKFYIFNYFIFIKLYIINYDILNKKMYNT